VAASQFKERLQAAEDWILANPNPPQRWPWTWLYKVGRSVYALARDVFSGQLTLHAMSLVYTSLLSVVPLLALSFSVLKALGVHQRMEPFLFQFFEPMGPQGIELAEKIQRFSNYLSVIMVGPLLMVSAIGVSATILSSSLVQTLIAIEPLGSVILAVSRFMPFFLVVGAFTFVYVFMPNTSVKLRYAFIGGLVAGVSWQAGGMLFASFVAGSAKYAAIYSSFAIGIILLIWIYLNWMILLLGASLAFYLQNPGSVAKRRDIQLAPELQEKVALALMWLVAKPFSEGRPAPRQETLEQELRVPGEVTRGVSDKLIRAGLLTLAGKAGDQLVPGRTLASISTGDVLAAVRQDEDRVVERLPGYIPVTQMQAAGMNAPRLFSELLREDEAAVESGVTEESGVAG